jgi:hypothetical protein
MRIISQDGRFDLPYELVAISTHAINMGQVIAKPLTNIDRLFCVMGEYSTEEKAVNAMKTLRAEYEKFQETKSINGNYFALVYPKVFRFPQDSDM